MNIVHATWEKENLGIDSKEYILNENDTVDELLEIREELETVEYAVVKIPVARFDLSTALTQLGFTFIEGSLNLKLDLREFKSTKIQERINKDVSYVKMDGEDLNFLFSEIRNGLFKTDRIILDPKFTMEQSSKRYINWVSSELEKGCEIFKIIYKEKPFGFFSLKQINSNVYYPFLAGIYNEFINSGLGFLTIRKIIEEVSNRGGKQISTYVSSNNNPVLKTHIKLGFNIFSQNYVFVKHNKKK